MPYTGEYQNRYEEKPRRVVSVDGYAFYLADAGDIRPIAEIVAEKSQVHTETRPDGTQVKCFSMVFLRRVVDNLQEVAK